MGILSKLFKKKQPEPERPKFSFCETVTATAVSSWHIRRLTEVGLKTSGGADTPSLCGRQVSWDLQVPVKEIYLSHACPKCVEEYRKESRCPVTQ